MRVMTPKEGTAVPTRPATEVVPFPEVLAQLRKGAAVDEFTAALAELVQAVTYTGKKGTLTLKLNVSPSKTDDSAVEVVDDLKVTVPKPPQKTSLFFADDSGSLTRHDPRQGRLHGLGDDDE